MFIMVDFVRKITVKKYGKYGLSGHVLPVCWLQICHRLVIYMPFYAHLNNNFAKQWVSHV